MSRPLACLSFQASRLFVSPLVRVAMSESAPVFFQWHVCEIPCYLVSFFYGKADREYFDGNMESRQLDQ